MEKRQDFVGPVDQVIQAGVVTLNAGQQDRSLTMSERKELNARIKVICERGYENAWDVWRVIHRAAGVDSVDELTLLHRDMIIALLDLLDEQGELKSRLSEHRVKRGEMVLQIDQLEQELAEQKRIVGQQALALKKAAEEKSVAKRAGRSFKRRLLMGCYGGFALALIMLCVFFIDAFFEIFYQLNPSGF